LFPGDGSIRTQLYFYIDNVDDLYKTFTQSGLKYVELALTDQTWNMREMYVKDPDGNCLRFGTTL